ncbi:hypothetical protein CKAH01_13527 [Colletotrichum kahawae]|uniref:Uncharacterized protein n=1 Tax=Colletotrichum kahawae TaxID=34407 RepID=A0AAD9YSH0_COLKA|nr:hypothetical protein CKAH01_13527 [Colletotrichum kahawae]
MRRLPTEELQVIERRGELQPNATQPRRETQAAGADARRRGGGTLVWPPNGRETLLNGALFRSNNRDFLGTQRQSSNERDGIDVTKTDPVSGNVRQAEVSSHSADISDDGRTAGSS